MRKSSSEQMREYRKKNRQVSFILKPEEYDDLKKIAEANGMSVTGMIRHFIEQNKDMSTRIYVDLFHYMDAAHILQIRKWTIKEIERDIHGRRYELKLDDFTFRGYYYEVRAAIIIKANEPVPKLFD